MTEVDSSLDLSHLTEEEQSSILQVLQRDLELRNLDKDRIRNLEQTESNSSRLGLLSGEWFNKECSKRHRRWTSGCELIRASICHRKTKSRDVNLNELFTGEKEETPLNSFPPQTKERLQEKKEEESEGSEENLTPDFPLRPERPVEHVLNNANSSSPSKECETRSNGHSEEPEEDFFVGLNGDSDFTSSSLAEPDPAYLKTSSSNGSLRSSHMLGGSMMSLFSSGDFGAVEVRGRIQYSLVYDNDREELQVRVYRCEDIASARKNRSDPYVKTYLLPDKSNHSKKKTSVKKKTLNPVYDQTLRYKLKIGELRSRTLNLSVWHAEPLGRNIFLGEVEVTLGLWDWTCTEPLWQDLQPRVHVSQESISIRGNIVLSIKFVPEGCEGGGLPLTGEVHIWLREAQGLLSKKGGAIDSFVRSYILPDVSQQSGQKTRLVKRSFSPTYNHTMVYDGFQTSDLREACAELTVCQKDGLKTNVLGGIRLSCGTGQSYGEPVSWMDSTEDEVALWTSMIENPNRWIDSTLPIRTNLTQRSV
uniref:Synaptotagmin-like protein 1 n=1 Tax=Fundulus heteroclitus TaxID=8078 RepID=A0A147B3I1_FUNHE